MYKVLIVVAMIVGLVAVVGVGAVMLGGRTSEPSPAVNVKTAEVVAESAAAAAVPADDKSATRTRSLAKIGAAAESEVAGSEAGAAEAQEAEKAPEPGAIAKMDAETIVSNLTPDQEEQVMRLLMDKMREKRKTEYRYQVPTGMRIQQLDHMGKEELKLSDSQKQQLAAIQETLKPRMDATLAANWARNEEIQKTIRTSFEGVKSQDEMAQAQQQIQPLYKELNELREQSEQIKQTFDKEYSAMARPILSQVQAQALDNMTAGSTNSSGGGQMPGNWRINRQPGGDR